MKQKIFYLFILLCLPLWVLADNASNVRVRQHNKDIIITYDLSKTSNVQVFMATNANNSFTPLKAVEGAVGNNVHAGQGLEIVWHPLNERETFIAEGVRFKVEALGSYEQYLMPGWNGGKSDMETFITADISYSSAPQVGGGLMLGQTYFGYGWFVTMHSNFKFQSATDGMTCGEGGYIDNVLPFYSGRTQSSAFNANIGFVMDILDVADLSPFNRFNTFGFYVGGGYGWRRMLWETIDGKWIEYSPTSIKGFSADIGLIGSYYGFTMKLGINTINFKYLELEAGIGWMF